MKKDVYNITLTNKPTGTDYIEYSIFGNEEDLLTDVKGYFENHPFVDEITIEDIKNALDKKTMLETDYYLTIKKEG